MTALVIRQTGRCINECLCEQAYVLEALHGIHLAGHSLQGIAAASYQSLNTAVARGKDAGNKKSMRCAERARFCKGMMNLSLPSPNLHKKELSYI